MNITMSQKQGRIPVTLLGLAGKLGGSNYQQLLEEAQKVYLNGTRDLLIDLSN